MAQEQLHQQASKRETPEAETSEVVKRSSEADELIKHSDELLDEIDGLLEGLDEDLAATFVQRGGE